MIEVQQLSKKYNNVEVLNIQKLTIEKGEIVGLVGNNGAGKTTFFQLMLNFIEATTGEIIINGLNVAKNEAFKTFTSAYLDEHFLIEFLTAEEFFYFVGDARNISKADVDLLLSGFSSVFNGEVLGHKKYLRSFSKGNQKKVGLVSTLIGNSELVIWDEPFANLDPSTQIRMKEVVRKFSNNKTWIISSHDLQHIYEISTRIVILEKGIIIKDIQKKDTTFDELVSIFSR